MPSLTPSLPAAFLTFLKTGALYGIGLGCTLEDVRKVFGPETTSFQGDSMWFLDWDALPAQFTFDPDNGVLWGIQFDGDDLEQLFPSLNNLSPDEIGPYLLKHEIPYTDHPDPEFGENAFDFHLPYGIEFAFCDEPEEGLPVRLIGIYQDDALLPHLVLHA